MRVCSPVLPRTSKQRGVVLFLALIALLLIAAVGAAILFMAGTESGIVGNQRLAARVFYAAEAGLEEARLRLHPAVSPAVGGINFISIPVLGLPAPVFPCTSSELPNTFVPCNTVDDKNRYNLRRENVVYILNTAPTAPGSDPTAPASPTNDPALANEITNPSVNSIASIQPGAGTNTSVPYSWVRINLKTEWATGQDLNFDGILDENPIFYFQDRQYTLPDLLVFDPTGLLLPPPWGPTPTNASGAYCQGLACASPVYMLTAYSTVPAPRAPGGLLRAEVAVDPSYAVNAAIYSVPPIAVSGTSLYIGYDGCNPACPTGSPVTLPTSPPSGCNFVVPLQTQDSTLSTVSGTSADTYPAPPCPDPSVSGPGDNACVQLDVPPPYNIDELIERFLPADVTLPPGSYQNHIMGTFPFADPVGGADAIPQITHVTGTYECQNRCSGAGVLIVDGDLRYNASMEFYGMVIVRGSITALGGGSPKSGCNFYGGLIAGGGIQTQAGGAICYHYNTCALNINSRKSPILRLSFRPLPG